MYYLNIARKLWFWIHKPRSLPVVYTLACCVEAMTQPRVNIICVLSHLYQTKCICLWWKCQKRNIFPLTVQNNIIYSDLYKARGTRTVGFGFFYTKCVTIRLDLYYTYTCGKVQTLTYKIHYCVYVLLLCLSTMMSWLPTPFLYNTVPPDVPAVSEYM